MLLGLATSSSSDDWSIEVEDGAPSIGITVMAMGDVAARM